MIILQSIDDHQVSYMPLGASRPLDAKNHARSPVKKTNDDMALISSAGKSSNLNGHTSKLQRKWNSFNAIKEKLNTNDIAQYLSNVALPGLDGTLNDIQVR